MLHMLTCCITYERVKGNQAKISHAIRNFVICEKLSSLLYLLVFFPDTLKIVTTSLFTASEQVQGVAEVSS